MIPSTVRMIKQPLSTNVEAIGYETNTKTLFVQYKRTRATYAYEGVPKSTFDNSRSYSSISTWINNEIKGVYNYKKL